MVAIAVYVFETIFGMILFTGYTADNQLLLWRKEPTTV